MTLPVKWYDNEHSIILATITANTTWEEYHRSVDWIVTEAAKVDHRVDLIFHDDVGMPKGNPVPHLSRGSARIVAQPNIHMVIIAGSQGSGGFVRAILMVIGKSFSKLYLKSPRGGEGLLFIKTLDEALARIQQDRARTSIA
jgi:hypothetical protein